MKLVAPKRLSGGKYVDLNNFTEKDVSIDDIDRSLNYIYRFTGHWKDKPPLTVAQHSLLTTWVAEDLFPDEPEVAFDCLLHDMPEAYYGDIATPVKKLLKSDYRKFVDQVDTAVYNALWKIPQPFTEEVESKRKICDLVALDIERRSMWESTYGKVHWPDIPNENFYSTRQKKYLFDVAQSHPTVPLKMNYEYMMEYLNDSNSE